MFWFCSERSIFKRQSRKINCLEFGAKRRKIFENLCLDFAQKQSFVKERNHRGELRIRREAPKIFKNLFFGFAPKEAFLKDEAVE